MARQVEFEPTKTYATLQNLEKAINRHPRLTTDEDLRYLALQGPDQRWYAIFLGEPAIQAGVHFTGFNIVG